jgi:opacity protein-like surface antigen
MRWTMIAVMLLTPAVALADNDSVLTLGLGSHAVVAHDAGAAQGQGSVVNMGQGFSARARFLWVFGGEFSYDLRTQRGAGTTNVPAPNYKLSGLFYLIPQQRFSLYLVGGLGASNAGDLLSTSGTTTSYHGGLGIEIAVTSNWVVSADFRVNLPNYGDVLQRGKRDALANGDLPPLSSYYSLDTWQITLGVRYYL